MSGLVGRGASQRSNLTLRLVGAAASTLCTDSWKTWWRSPRRGSPTLTPGRTLRPQDERDRLARRRRPADNLVLKAAQLLRRERSRLKTGSFELEKVLPVAAGHRRGFGGSAAALAACWRG